MVQTQIIASVEEEAMLVGNTGRQPIMKLSSCSAILATLVALAASAPITRLFGQSATVRDKFYSGGRTQEGDVGPVAVHDFATGETREFYRPVEGFVFDFKPSPSGDLVAISTQVSKFGVSSQEATVFARGQAILERKMLHILTATGAEITTLPQVRSYAWSPDGGQLAYVTGEYRGVYDSYANTAAWIWNATTNEGRRISDKGHDVTWARFDNNIYLWPRTDGIAGKAVRYKVSTGQLEPTTHLSIYFSPTGDYYFHPGGGTGLPENVYRRSSDLSLKETSRILLSLPGWRQLGWAPDADLLLMHVSRKSAVAERDEPATIIYNPADDSSVDLGVLEVLGWGGTANDVIVRNGTRIEKKRVEEVKKLAQR